MAGGAEVIRNLYAWAREKKAGIEAVGRVSASNIQNYARKNKRWIDRTGMARAGLNAGNFWQSPEVMIIYLAHAVSYGVYLELCNDGKYAILEEAINKYREDIHKNLKKVMGIN
jgi:hypothetical protein